MDYPDRLIMELASLERIPLFKLQAGFNIRRYRSGDERHWLDIHLDADNLSPITATLFAEQFGMDAAELKARQLYLCHGKDVIGTCTAWHDKEYKDGAWGRVHWLAIKTEFQGRGLSKPLLSRTCLLLAELGHTKAYLTTLARRPGAIKLYEKFGFKAV